MQNFVEIREALQHNSDQNARETKFLLADAIKLMQRAAAKGLHFVMAPLDPAGIRCLRDAGFSIETIVLYKSCGMYAICW